MGLAPDIGLRGIILGVERVKVLLQPLVGRDAGIDRAVHRFCGSSLHAEAPFSGLSRSPKNRGPFQRVPVIAKATCDRALVSLAVPGKAVGDHRHPLHASVPFAAKDGARPHVGDTLN
jgi:hypothetical protein